MQQPKRCPATAEQGDQSHGGRGGVHQTQARLGEGLLQEGERFRDAREDGRGESPPPKLLSHTVHLQWKLTFNFCCRCCCEKGSGGVQDRRGEEPGQQGLLEQGQAAHQGGAEAEGQGRKAEQAKLFLRQQQEEVRRSRNTLCFKVFPSILFFFLVFRL